MATKKAARSRTKNSSSRGGRKTSAKKSTGRKATSRKAPSRKKAAKKTARKSSARKSTARKSTSSSSRRRYSPKAGQKVGEEMHEFKRGRLRSGSGRKVTNPKQAIAIGLSEARRSGAKVPRKKAA